MEVIPIKLNCLVILFNDFFFVPLLNFPINFFRFKNRPKMTFDEVSSKPDQEFELTKDVNGIVEYSTKYANIVLNGFFFFC